MNCHECARVGVERPALGLCRFCMVALCKEHVVASYQSAVVPQYRCEHRPERAFGATALEQRPDVRPARAA